MNVAVQVGVVLFDTFNGFRREVRCKSGFHFGLAEHAWTRAGDNLAILWTC